MNKIWVGCFLTSLYLPSVMAQAPLSLEDRLAQMEQRLKATEARAASAEAEIKTLKGQQQATTVARAARKMFEMEEKLHVAARFQRVENGLEKCRAMMREGRYGDAERMIDALIRFDQEENNGL